MSLSIALTADPELPVPPLLYGGIERIIDMLAHAFLARGHQVTVFAHPDSTTPARLVPWPGRSSRSKADSLRNSATLAREVMRTRFDVVHSFSRLAYLAPILALPIPKVMTYQRAISPRTVRLSQTLSRGTLQFTAISHWMMREVEGVGNWRMVPNGVSLDDYVFQSSVANDAPLVFLGRLEEIKGPHLAIEVAKRANKPLILAGNVPFEHEAWFQAHIAPHIDGDRVKYIGPVGDTQKNELLGSAFAFLMPVLWDEPFGIVMAEAMACGTPVIGLDRGAVPEVVLDGVTGFVRDDLEGLVSAVAAAGNLNRAACRSRVESLYSAEVIADQYIETYVEQAARCGRIARPPVAREVRRR